jgi:hypothetical protein
MQPEYTAVPVRAGEAGRNSTAEEKDAKGIASWLMIGLVAGSVGIYMYDRYEAKAHLGKLVATKVEDEDVYEIFSYPVSIGGLLLHENCSLRMNNGWTDKSAQEMAAAVVLGTMREIHLGALRSDNSCVDSKTLSEFLIIGLCGFAFVFCGILYCICSSVPKDNDEARRRRRTRVVATTRVPAVTDARPLEVMESGQAATLRSPAEQILYSVNPLAVVSVGRMESLEAKVDIGRAV